MTAEVVYLPPPRREDMTPEQVEHWQHQASYWAIREEDSHTALEYAQRQRENCLRMLGMLPLELGVPDGVA